MSLYIHSENQKMLWDSIQTSPLFNVCFNNDDKKYIWFKSIIRMFYEKNPNKIGKAELSEMNHKTIVYMVKEMKTLITSPSTTSNTTPNTGSNTILSSDISSFTTMPYISNYDNNQEERIKTIEYRLVEKQHEMNSLLHHPSPPEIDFRISEKDEPILNIDELLQKHIRDRELYQEIPHQLQPQSILVEPSILELEPSILELEPSILAPSILELEPSILELEPSILELKPSILEPSLITNNDEGLSSKLDKLIYMVNILTQFIIKKNDKEVVEELVKEVVEELVIEEVVEELVNEEVVLEIDVVVEEVRPRGRDEVVVEEVVMEDVVEDVVLEDVVVEVKKKRGRGKGKSTLVTKI